MEKEKRITAPEGCEIEKVEIVDGAAVVTFREKERKLPKSWEEFCKMFDVGNEEFFIDEVSTITNAIKNKAFMSREQEDDRNILPDRATAEAILALCQLIQLRNCYNGDWVPNFNRSNGIYFIIFDGFKDIRIGVYAETPRSFLYFKTEELCDEFLRNFRDLIEKLEPLYGIKEGGEDESW